MQKGFGQKINFQLINDLEGVISALVVTFQKSNQESYLKPHILGLNY